MHFRLDRAHMTSSRLFSMKHWREMEMAEVKRGEVGQDWGLGDLWTEQMEV